MLPLLQAINPPLGLGQGGKMTDLLKLTRNMMIPIHEANYIHFGELLYALSENLCGASLPDKTRIAQKITRKLKKKLPMWGQPLQVSFGVWLAVIKAQKMWKRIIAQRKLMEVRQQRQEKLEKSQSKLRVLSRYKGSEHMSLDTFSGSPIPEQTTLDETIDPEYGVEEKTMNESTLQASETRPPELLPPILNPEPLSRNKTLPNQARNSESKPIPGVTESSPGLIKCSIIPDGPPNSFESEDGTEAPRMCDKRELPRILDPSLMPQTAIRKDNFPTQTVIFFPALMLDSTKVESPSGSGYVERSPNVDTRPERTLTTPPPAHRLHPENDSEEPLKKASLRADDEMEPNRTGVNEVQIPISAPLTLTTSNNKKSDPD